MAYRPALDAASASSWGTLGQFRLLRFRALEWSWLRLSDPACSTRVAIFPCILAAVGMMIGQPSLYPLALIWSAHIGFDRLIGYGLKYSTGFKETHLGRIGKKEGGEEVEE